MMNGGGRAAASPGPAAQDAKKPNHKNKTLTSLLQMHKEGLLSREEVRTLIFKEMGVTSSQRPSSSPKPPGPLALPARPGPNPIRDPSPPNRAVPKRAVPKPKKRVVPKPKPKPIFLGEGTLRDLCKNITRRRFFHECCKADSKLWYETPGGKQTMHRLLFEKAAEDCVELLFKEYAAPLRKTRAPEVRAEVNWRVMKDRNNWSGRTPRRKPFEGAAMPFDFLAALAVIEERLEGAADLTVDDGDNGPNAVKPEPNAVKPEPDVVKSEPKNVKNCLHCREQVWTGEVSKCPVKTIKIAHPLGTDWSTSAQPYCDKCWKKEEELLEKLGAQHKAVGPRIKGTKGKGKGTKAKGKGTKTKRKKQVKRKLTLFRSRSQERDLAVIQSQDAAVQQAIAGATTPPPPPAKRQKTAQPNKNCKGNKPNENSKGKKKQLGGVRVSIRKPVQRWQVGNALTLTLTLLSPD